MSHGPERYYQAVARQCIRSGLCPIERKSGSQQQLNYRKRTAKQSDPISMSLSWTGPRIENVAAASRAETTEARVSERILVDWYRGFWGEQRDSG